jgi:type I restriction enzyme, S subunit
MSFPKYEVYKDSGVEWLGEVPEQWNVISLKWLSPILRGASPRPIDDPKYFDDEGEYGWVRIADVSSSNGHLFETTQRLSNLGSSLSVKLEPESLFLSIAGTVGKPCVTKIKACIHDGFVHFPQLTIDHRILYRIFESGLCFGGLGKMGTQLNLNTETVGGIRVALPPPDELITILNFLDRETTRIDALIAEQQRLIELLKEKRQAVISHAVTKGIDRTVPMKDSGVEWLGEVPEHWSVINFQLVVYIAEGQVNPTISPYSKMVLIAPNHIESRTGRILYLETAEEQGADSGKYLCQTGDVVYSKIRPALRKVCIAPEDSLCSADMYPMRGHSGMSNNYLFWFILSEPFSAFALLESERVAMPKINRDSLGRLKVVRPPQSEQVKIASYLI